MVTVDLAYSFKNACLIDDTVLVLLKLTLFHTFLGCNVINLNFLIIKHVFFLESCLIFTQILLCIIQFIVTFIKVLFCCYCMHITYYGYTV